MSVAVTCVKKGDKADLRNFILDEKEKEKAADSVPYYVSLTFTNIGPKVLHPFALTTAVVAVSGEGDQIPTRSLNTTDFDKCNPTYPDTLAVAKCGSGRW